MFKRTWYSLYLQVWLIKYVRIIQEFSKALLIGTVSSPDQVCEVLKKKIIHIKLKYALWNVEENWGTYVYKQEFI